MNANTQNSIDLDSLSIGGTDFIAVIEGATISFKNATVDTAAISDGNEIHENTKRGCTITVPMQSVVTGTQKVVNTDMSAITVGGTSYKVILETLSINGSNAIKSAEGAAADLWEWPQVGRQSLTANGTIFVPTAAFPALGGTLAVGTAAAQKVSLSTTINGVTITIPMVLNEQTFTASGDEMQKVSFSLAPGGAASAPSGTGSLLAAFLNDRRTALAFECITAATNGKTYAGNVVFESFNLEVPVSGKIMTSYTFRSQGAVT